MSETPPVPSVVANAPDHQPEPKATNGFGLASMIVGIVTMAGFAIPFLNFATIVTGIAGVALGIIGLVIKLRPRKAAIAGVILSALGLILSVVLVIVYAAALAGAAKALEGPTVGPADPSVSASADPDAKESFENGVLTTSDVKIEITDHKVIPVGQPGNEYGDKPVLAIFYKTTNLTDKETTPLTAWLFSFEAIQDNDPNAENTLDVGLTPGDQYLEAQSQNIKNGGTVESAISYQLTDSTTPVELTASTGLRTKTVGKVTYTIQ